MKNVRIRRLWAFIKGFPRFAYRLITGNYTLNLIRRLRVGKYIYDWQFRALLRRKRWKLFDPSLNAVTSSCCEHRLFEKALECARLYEQSTGHKHHLWEQIIAGLVEQDEIERYGGE